MTQEEWATELTNQTDGIIAAAWGYSCNNWNYCTNNRNYSINSKLEPI